MKLYALHTIHRRVAGAVEVIPAKSVFSGTADELKDLGGRNAARAASKDEIALAEASYKAKNGGSADGFEEASSESVSKPVAAKKGKTKAEPKGEGAAEQQSEEKDADI